jgi:hypothetical protein
MFSVGSSGNIPADGTGRKSTSDESDTFSIMLRKFQTKTQNN